jgi:dihydroxyacetone kinase-like predicted kinase
MRRDVSDKNILNNFCLKFCRVLSKHVEYIVVSGFVAIASGRTRGTEDIDIIIRRMSSDDFRELYKDLIKEGFVCIQSFQTDEIFNYLKDNLSVRYCLKNQPVPQIELKFEKDKLDDYQFKTKEKLPLTDLDVWFSSVNMNVAFKEELLKSPKDMEDARYLRLVYKEKIKEREIEKIKKMIKEMRL